MRQDDDYQPEEEETSKSGEALKLQRLQFLLDQASVFSQFLSQKICPTPREETKGELKKRKITKETKVYKKQKGEKQGTGKLSQPASKAQPALVTGGQLKEYQLEGVSWLASLWVNGINGILADEMGLGKTIQTIAFIAHLFGNGVQGPFLIVGPLSTLANWMKEIAKWTPTIPALLYHGTKSERAEIRDKHFPTAFTSRKGIIVTSYEIVLNDSKYLARRRWRYLVVDEGHRLKNMNCRLIRELKTYNSANRLLLTGTPLQNNLTELWSLLSFLMPQIFDDPETFRCWFDFDSVGTEEGNRQILMEEKENQIVTKLHRILQPFLLRRVKADVELHLPKKQERVIYTHLTPLQHKYYTALLNKRLSHSPHPISSGSAHHPPTTVISAEIVGGTAAQVGNAAPAADADADGDAVPGPGLQNLIMQLRKCCNHPFLFDWPNVAMPAHSPALSQTSEEAQPSQLTHCLRKPPADASHDGEEASLDEALQQPPLTAATDESLVKTSGKMEVLDRLLPRLLAEGHKVLIFSQMTRMLDILQHYMHLRSFPSYRIDGSTPQPLRQSQIEEFNGSGEACCFLLSTRAGGLGINLSAADVVIFFDSDWNPQMDLQAQDRCHRIGQTRPVRVYRLVTANSVESRILERANNKLKLGHLVLAGKMFEEGELVALLSNDSGLGSSVGHCKPATDEELFDWQFS